MTTLVPSFLDDLLLAGYKTNHEILDEFEFQQDFIAEFGVICP